MQRKFLALLFTYLSWHLCHAQHVLFNENFSGKYANTFIGDTDLFQINSNACLQLNGHNFNDTASLWHSFIDSTWQEQTILLELRFSPSTSNAIRWYLAATSHSLNDSNSRAYYIEVGENGNADTWHLKKRVYQQITDLGAGPLGLLAKTQNKFRLRVRYSNTRWEISIDSNGSRQFEKLVCITDSISFLPFYGGISCIYTSTRSKSFLIDDWYIGDSLVDYSAPYIQRKSIELPNKIHFLFSECVRKESAQRQNFLFDGTPIDSIYRDNSDYRKLNVVMNKKMTEGVHYIFCSSVIDEAGNSLQGVNIPINVSQANYGELLISEIMADPSPSIGMPNIEYIELFNRSLDSIPLGGIYLGDSSYLNRLTGDRQLHSHEYMIICATNGCSQFPGKNCYNFNEMPSLNNDGDKIYLLNNDSILLDVVSYDKTYYGDEYKSNGGYSLERTDVNTICSGTKNWHASESAVGGTPGEANSISTSNSPHEKFEVLHGALRNGHCIELFCNEQLQTNTLSAGRLICAAISDTLTNPQYSYAAANAIMFNSDQALDSFMVYEVRLEGIRNCFGQTIDAMQPIPICFGFEADTGELTINEILFNPRPGDHDFLEIENTGQRGIDLRSLRLSKRINGECSTFYQPIKSLRNIAPKEILCFSEDPQLTAANYPTNALHQIVQSVDLCTMNDDSDAIVLLNAHGRIIDEVRYNTTWHNRLLEDVEGVSLERRSAKEPGTSENNWLSGRATDGFATPGLTNAAAYSNSSRDTLSAWSLYPKVLTPNGDGIDDQLMLQARIPTEALVVEVKILAENGQLIRSICGPQTISNQSWQIWNGLTEDYRVAPAAIYFVCIRYGELNKKTKTILLPFYVDSAKNF